MQLQFDFEQLETIKYAYNLHKINRLFGRIHLTLLILRCYNQSYLSKSFMHIFFFNYVNVMNFFSLFTFVWVY